MVKATKKSTALLVKPKLTTTEVREFAEAKRSPRTNPPPAGDSRLMCNVREDLHFRIKLFALRHKTTVGEIIEKFIEEQIPEE